MLPIHTVLHPTDFSDRSRVAFGLACALARDYGARLVVLHVLPHPTVVYGEGIVPPEPEGLHERLKEELYKLRAPAAGPPLDHRLEEGDPVTRIIDVAQDVGADLIVMGTHGRTGLGRLLMGSVAERVVRRASCPVLTVRSPFPAAVTADELAAEPAAV